MAPHASTSSPPIPADSGKAGAALAAEISIPATGDLTAKLERLDDYLRAAAGGGKLIVAYSGGVDSAFLLHRAHAALGDGALGVIGVSPSLAGFELEAARNFASERGLPLREIHTAELEDPRYAENPANRCYFCKSELFDKLNALAVAEDFSAVLDGTNADDLGGHRPGYQAAGERRVRSPLAELGFTKADVRASARAAGLAVADKPSVACLASRFPTGSKIDADRLARIAACETFLHSNGFGAFRVRFHDKVARLELDAAGIARLLGDVPLRAAVDAHIRAQGFAFVALDLREFSTGSLSRARL